MNSRAYELCANLCREFEGLRLEKYRCPAGYWTIGYGHRCSETQKPITTAEAENLLREDILKHYEQLIKESPGISSETPGRIAALTDFVFNLGINRYAGSTFRAKLVAGHWEIVPDLLRKWVYGGGKILPGLVRRREAECQLLN